MSARRRKAWALWPVGLVAVALAGCGQGSRLGHPTVPLVPGAHVVQQASRCDKGSHVYCAVFTVVSDRHFRDAGLLLISERRYLHHLGWSLQEGEIQQERSAVSPSQKLRLVYATAAGDLLAVDLGWVKRPSSIAQALANTMFEHVPAISLMVEAGPA